MGAVCFQLTHFFVMIEIIYKLCLIVIIKSELRTITHCSGLGHETMVCTVCLSIFLSYAVGLICIPRKLGLVSFITEQSYHMRKWSNTLWPDGGIRLFLHYITSLSLLCRRIWRYCTSKILGREILPREFLRLRFFFNYLSCNIWASVYSACPFILWCLYEYVYFILLSPNWEYDPFAIV